MLWQNQRELGARSRKVREGFYCPSHSSRLISLWFRMAERRPTLTSPRWGLGSLTFLVPFTAKLWSPPRTIVQPSLRNRFSTCLEESGVSLAKGSGETQTGRRSKLGRTGRSGSPSLSLSRVHSLTTSSSSSISPSG